MQRSEPPPGSDSFADDVAYGLGRTPKYLLAKYFYDKLGSELFEQITEQPEYYPTRTEAAILRSHADDIRDALNDDISLVELGSGSSNKTVILLESILEEQSKLHYLPIDISPKMLSLTAERLDSEFGGLTTIPIPSEYGAGLSTANDIISDKDHIPDRKLVLFLGSSIGNLDLTQSRDFLRMIRKNLREGDALLAGFDLQKEREILNAAYNDKAGITARFNLNILTRINRELDGEFDLEQFYHRAFYNEDAGRIEMHLVSAIEQTVPIGKLQKCYRFEIQESIHTESSYKFTLDKIQSLARDSGLEMKKAFRDERKWFALALLVPA